jgi:predicted nucleotidyltransferase
MRRYTYVHRSSVPEPRKHLISAGLDFVEAVSQMPGVERVALVGSICTTKPDPKDVDVLVTIAPSVDMEKLATLGRKLKGAMQGINSGADIFLAGLDGTYLGRTCSYKECHYRRSCEGRHCRPASYLCDDLHNLDLDRGLIANPPLVLHPQIVVRGELPGDLMDEVKMRFGSPDYHITSTTFHGPFSRALLTLATHRGGIKDRLVLAGMELAKISKNEYQFMPEGLGEDFKKFMDRLAGHGPIPESVKALTEEEAEDLARDFLGLWKRLRAVSAEIPVSHAYDIH